MSEPRWSVEATYPGFDDRDYKINRAVGRGSDGSGCGFGVRDMEWYYHQKPAAERAIARIQKANIPEVEVRLIDMNEDWDE